MQFYPTSVNGARLISPDPRWDERGFFARFFCEREFADNGLERSFVQINNSLSTKKGTLRGPHYQLPPCAEVKVVRCVRGALYDAIVDLRPNSPTYRKWFGAELTADNRFMMYVPRGCAHAMLTLSDGAEAIYLVSAFYEPEQERGVRWNDPAIGIKWPIEPADVSLKDAAWPDLDPAFHGIELMRGLS